MTRETKLERKGRKKETEFPKIKRTLKIGKIIFCKKKLKKLLKISMKWSNWHKRAKLQSGSN